MQKIHSIYLKKTNKILQIISSVLDIDKIMLIIGQRQVQYLLVYITGLIILEKKQTTTGISDILKICIHDSLCRLLWKMDFPLKFLMKMITNFIENTRTSNGYLILDDSIINKRFSKKIQCAGYCWSSSDGRAIMGVHLVLLYWTDGYWRLPIGFRLWMPKNKTRNYQTKLDLARKIIVDNIEFCKTCEYIVFDSWYCSKKFLKIMKGLNITAITRIKKNRNIIFKGQKKKVREFSLGFKEIVYLPGFGEVFLICTKIADAIHYLISTDIEITDEELKNKYKARWPVEEYFRATKQCLGLEACQCRKNKAVINHITLVIIASVVMEILSKKFSCDIYEMKRILQDLFYDRPKEYPELKLRRAILKKIA